jgi:hypothetical protein
MPTHPGTQTSWFGNPFRESTGVDARTTAGLETRRYTGKITKSRGTGTSQFANDFGYAISLAAGTRNVSVEFCQPWTKAKNGAAAIAAPDSMTNIECKSTMKVATPQRAWCGM